MTSRIPAALVVIAMTTSGALAAPAQLYGKSVTVGWSEQRMQSTAMSAAPQSISALGQLQVYISDKGRAFTRVSMAVTNMRNRTRSGNRDAVQGEGTARSVTFGANSMTMTAPRGNAGALMIAVKFDANYQSCSAHVITGKTGGAQSTRVHSMITGAMVDVYSVQTSGESCSIQNGNVFGN